MLQIRRILLRGSAVVDAEISFESGANVLTGESDTGKSFLLHCLDYIFGANKLKKRFDVMAGYSNLFVEFSNDKGDEITLERNLLGKYLLVHYSRIDNIQGAGEKVLAKRSAKSKHDDVTSVLFRFAGIPNAQLRKNGNGELVQLSIRQLIPIFLIDEKSVISDDSSIIGPKSFDNTARKRMFAFLLSGKDDRGLVASEKKEIAQARLNAQLAIIDRLIVPLKNRLATHDSSESVESTTKIDQEITKLARVVESTSNERQSLQSQRRVEIQSIQYAESQILAINELQGRYDLLDERYRSDLKRLDFIAEGAHYLDALQVVNCPCCNQPFSASHGNETLNQIDNTMLQIAAIAEAKKILALIKDLDSTTKTLQMRKSSYEQNLQNLAVSLTNLETTLAEVLEPATRVSANELDVLVNRRIELESFRQDQTQLEQLHLMRATLEKASENSGEETSEWESIPTRPLNDLCTEIEKILIEWKWAQTCRVEFDDVEFDIVVDGQSRQSHGKGVRAILYSALVLALLRFCKKNDLPHPGTVVIDSPLTSYKKGGKPTSSDVPVSAGIEDAFWRSLLDLGKDVQVIVIENKEPPDDVASAVHYTRFAGEVAEKGERAGFIPTVEPRTR